MLNTLHTGIKAFRVHTENISDRLPFVHIHQNHLLKKQTYVRFKFKFILDFCQSLTDEDLIRNFPKDFD